MTIRAMPWPLFALAALFLGACSARSKPVDDARQRWTIEQLPRTEAPTLATVKPPREPSMAEITVPSSDARASLQPGAGARANTLPTLGTLRRCSGMTRVLFAAQAFDS
jgi:hypothetical protein